MNRENIDSENVTAEEKTSYEIVGVRFKENGKHTTLTHRARHVPPMTKL